jgi:plasmid stabilization system protein ParE
VNLQILIEAEEEIEKARKFLNRRSPGLGQRFLADLAESLSDIAADPQRFPKVETLPDDSPFRRDLLRVFRYAVVFEIVDDSILIIAVAHCSREPNYWIRRRS